MKKVSDYYIFRGEWIQPFGGGWVIEREMCCGETTGIPIYKSLIDAKNRINKTLDGTHTSEPRIIGTAGWSEPINDWFLEKNS